MYSDCTVPAHNAKQAMQVAKHEFVSDLGVGASHDVLWLLCIDSLSGNAEKSIVCFGLCRETIAKFVGNTFPGPIYPGYADRLASRKFEVTPSSPGFPVTGEVC